jgi:hypothetical protein
MTTGTKGFAVISVVSVNCLPFEVTSKVMGITSVVSGAGTTLEMVLWPVGVVSVIIMVSTGSQVGMMISGIGAGWTVTMTSFVMVPPRDVVSWMGSGSVVALVGAGTVSVVEMTRP